MSRHRRTMASWPAFTDSVELDAAAAERLLASQPATAFTEHVQLAALLAALSEPPPPGPLPGEEAALTAFRAEMRKRSYARAPATLRPGARARLLAIVLGGGLTVGGGVAAAAAGYLPDPVQETARDMLSRINIDVPGPSGGDPADEGGTPADSPAGSEGGDDAISTDAPGNSDNAADPAQSADRGGPGNGKTMPDAASQGLSRADEVRGNGPTAKPLPLESPDLPAPATPAPPGGEAGNDQPPAAGPQAAQRGNSD